MRKKGLVNEYNVKVLEQAAKSLVNVDKDLANEVANIGNKLELDRCKRSKGVSFKK